MALEAAPEPVDSGQPFSPGFTFFNDFTAHLPQLSQAQREGLVAPIQLLELMAVVEAAPAAKSPRLDGLSYEFYKATFHTVGPFLLAAFQSALDRSRLPATMSQGAVRLLPKVPGVPAVSQFRPITLL